MIIEVHFTKKLLDLLSSIPSTSGTSGTCNSNEAQSYVDFLHDSTISTRKPRTQEKAYTEAPNDLPDFIGQPSMDPAEVPCAVDRRTTPHNILSMSDDKLSSFYESESESSTMETYPVPFTLNSIRQLSMATKMRLIA